MRQRTQVFSELQSEGHSAAPSLSLHAPDPSSGRHYAIVEEAMKKGDIALEDEYGAFGCPTPSTVWKYSPRRGTGLCMRIMD